MEDKKSSGILPYCIIGGAIIIAAAIVSVSIFLFSKANHSNEGPLASNAFQNNTTTTTTTATTSTMETTSTTAPASTTTTAIAPPQAEEVDYASLYEGVLQFYAQSPTVECYYLVDINHSGKKELIIDDPSTASADAHYDIYSSDTGFVTQLEGSFGSDTRLYLYNDNLHVYWTKMGAHSWSSVEISGNAVVCNEINSLYPSEIPAVIPEGAVPLLSCDPSSDGLLKLNTITSADLKRGNTSRFKKGFVGVNNLNFRNDMNQNADSIMMQLPLDTAINILYQYDGWYAIETQGAIGYVASKYIIPEVETNSDCAMHYLGDNINSALTNLNNSMRVAEPLAGSTWLLYDPNYTYTVNDWNDSCVQCGIVSDIGIMNNGKILPDVHVGMPFEDVQALYPNAEIVYNEMDDTVILRLIVMVHGIERELFYEDGFGYIRTVP